jgi:hypothetical protein
MKVVPCQCIHLFLFGLEEDKEAIFGLIFTLGTDV